MKKNLSATIAQKIIKDFLEGDDIRVGRKLPTQRELQNKYFVSRTTILKSLDILRENGLIYSIQGKGIFFSEDRLSLYLNGIYSYDYQLMKSGIFIKNVLLSSDIRKANEEVASKMGIMPGTEVIEIIRKKIDSKSGNDLILQCNYLNYNRFEGLDFTKLNNNRLYSVLGLDYDLNLTAADEQIMLARLERPYAELLDGNYGRVMRIDRVSYENEVVVEYTHTYLLDDNFKYDVKLNLVNPLF